MARLVENSDGFAARVSKYVPAEALVLYLTVENILRELIKKSGDGVSKADQFLASNGAGCLFVLCLVLIPIYLFAQRQKGASRFFAHALISMVLFCVWIYALHGVIFDKNVNFFGFLDGVKLADYHSSALSSFLLAVLTAASGVVRNRTGDKSEQAAADPRPIPAAADSRPIPAPGPKANPEPDAKIVGKPDALPANPTAAKTLEPRPEQVLISRPDPARTVAGPVSNGATPAPASTPVN